MNDILIFKDSFKKASKVYPFGKSLDTLASQTKITENIFPKAASSFFFPFKQQLSSCFSNLDGLSLK
jgi:hypothetical protein